MTTHSDGEPMRVIPQRELYPMHEAMVLLALSRSNAFKEIRRGRLRTVKRGRSRLVPADAIQEYVAKLADSSEVQSAEAA